MYMYVSLEQQVIKQELEISSYCWPIRELLVDNTIMGSSLVDNVRQKWPIVLKEDISKHQILSLSRNIDFHRNYQPLIFNVRSQPIITVKTSGFNGS